MYATDPSRATRFFVSFILTFWVLNAVVPAPALAQPSNYRQQKARRAEEMGEKFLAAGDSGSALGFYREAIALDRYRPNAYLGMASILSKRGSEQGASRAIDSGLSVMPNNPLLLAAKIRLLIASRSLRAARNVARILVRASPEDVGAQELRYDVAMKRGAWSEALSCVRAIQRLQRKTMSEETKQELSSREAALSQLRAVRFSSTEISF